MTSSRSKRSQRPKHRYFRTLDLKMWEEFGNCLAEDVTARYGTQAMDKPLHYDNRPTWPPS